MSRKGNYITDHLEKDYDAIVEGFRIGWVDSSDPGSISALLVCFQERDYPCRSQAYGIRVLSLWRPGTHSSGSSGYHAKGLEAQHFGLASAAKKYPFLFAL
jgi:hypothetical protein